MSGKVWLFQRSAFLIGCLLIILWLILYLPQIPTVVNISESNNNAKPISSKFAKHTMLPLTASSQTPTSSPTITISAVACGNRVNETLVMMKSAVLLSKVSLVFVVFCDEEATLTLQEKYNKWPSDYQQRSRLIIRPVTFPSEGQKGEWKKLLRPCASQRLFFPSLLTEVDALLYVDTDAVFLAPPEQIWRHFSLMNDVQIAALAPENEDPLISWYSRFARHPYFRPLGLNSGVILMNLTRMRAFNWQKNIQSIYLEYKHKIVYGDQDIINILFHFHPETVYVLTCSYNYRFDHCVYKSLCKAAEEEGIDVLHGSQRSFRNSKHPTFRVVHKVFRDFTWAEKGSIKVRLLKELTEALESTSSRKCGKVRHLMYKRIEQIEEE